MKPFRALLIITKFAVPVSRLYRLLNRQIFATLTIDYQTRIDISNLIFFLINGGSSEQLNSITVDAAW